VNDDFETWKLNLVKETLTGNPIDHPLNGHQAAWFIEAVIRTCPQPVLVSGLNGTALWAGVKDKAPRSDWQRTENALMSESAANHNQIQQGLNKHGLGELTTKHDSVNHPAHYTQGAVECIDAIEAALGRAGFVAFLRGQVMKYTWRVGLKGNAAHDAGKANWYGRRLEETLKRPVS